MGRLWLHSLLIASLGLGVGCTPGSDGGEPPIGQDVSSAPAVTASFDDTWVVFLAKNPTTIQSLLGSNPSQGWQLLYQRQYPGASKAFAGTEEPNDRIGQARAEVAMADLFGQAHELSLSVLAEMEDGLAKNANRIAVGPAATYFAASLALQSGDAPGASAAVASFLKASPNHALKDAGVAVRGAAKAAAGDLKGAKADLLSVQTADGKALAAAFAMKFAVEGVPLPDTDGLSAYGKRAQVYALVADGQLEEAQSLVGSLDHKAPDFSEEVGSADDRVERKYYDPLFYEALRALHARKAVKAINSAMGPADWVASRGEALNGNEIKGDLKGIEAGMTADSFPVFVFSEFATSGDLSSMMAQLAGGDAPAGLQKDFLDALGPVTSGPDQGRQVREAQDLGKAWQSALDKDLSSMPESDGVSMAQGLKLSRGLVASLLRGRAAQFIEAGKSLEGLALLEYTFEKEASSQITWINTPHLFLDTTRAYCQLDRYREALNYLYRLLDTYPELWTLYEVVGNLSVLDTLDRTGVDGQ